MTIEDIFDKQGFFKIEPEHHHYIADDGSIVDYYSLFDPFHYGTTGFGKEASDTMYIPYIEGTNNRNTDNVNDKFHDQVRDYIMQHSSEIHPLSDIVKYYFSGGVNNFTGGNYTDIYMWRHGNRNVQTLDEITLDKKCN